MTYVLIFLMLLLAACTVIHVSMKPGDSGEKGEPTGLNIQTSNSTSVLSAQNVAKDDKAGRGDLNSTQGGTEQSATSKPIVPIIVPIPSPIKPP